MVSMIINVCNCGPVVAKVSHKHWITNTFQLMYKGPQFLAHLQAARINWVRWISLSLCVYFSDAEVCHCLRTLPRNCILNSTCKKLNHVWLNSLGIHEPCLSSPINDFSGGKHMYHLTYRR